MTIDCDALIEILAKHGSEREDTPPREAPYSRFGGGERKVKETVTYHAADGTLVAIDLGEEENVLGIEIV